MRLVQVLGCTAALLLSSAIASAGYSNYGGLGPNDFTKLGTKWMPGPGAADFHPAPAPTGPGSATWSFLAAGIPSHPLFDTHGGALATDLTALSAAVDELAVIEAVLNAWAAVSGFTNLGQVVDGGGTSGVDGAASAVGDIRVGAYDLGAPSGVLAHAFGPSIEGMFADGNHGGDTHFDNNENWTDGGAGIDFYTVALHEIGHALGLGHSADPTAVMFAFYGGVRRTLTADDIDGIQAIYGPQDQEAVPEPATLTLAGLGLLTCVGGVWRKESRAAA